MPKAALPVLAAIFAAGCFHEPVPAYKTVPEGARVYFSNHKLKDLSVESTKWNPAVVDYLNLDRNELTNVSEVARFAELKWLRLNYNRLAELPDLRPLTKLRRIYLRANRFAEVPATLADLPALTDVELSHNPISEVPEWLAKKPGLKNLSFSHTKITKLPEDLSAWETLQSLQLGGLAISAEEMARIRKALPKVAIVF